VRTKRNDRLAYSEGPATIGGALRLRLPLIAFEEASLRQSNVNSKQPGVPPEAAASTASETERRRLAEEIAWLVLRQHRRTASRCTERQDNGSVSVDEDDSK
jgi:hypothetical protein